MFGMPAKRNVSDMSRFTRPNLKVSTVISIAPIKYILQPRAGGVDGWMLLGDGCKDL